MLTVELPWPNRQLSPNERVHYMTLARVKKVAKQEAWVIAKAAMGLKRVAYKSWGGPVAVTLTFHPRTLNYPDPDNALATMKAALDGISDALGIDDKHFRPVPIMGEKRAKACVVIELTPAVVQVPLRGVIS